MLATFSSLDSRNRVIGLIMLLLGLSLGPLLADSVDLTNLEGVTIQAEITSYDPATGLLSGKRVGGDAFTISMENLDLKSKFMVLGSPAGQESLQGWVPPLATAGTLFVMLMAIFLLIDFLGYWIGAAMVEGSRGPLPHLKVFAVILLLSFLANITQALVSAGVGGHSIAANCFVSGIAILLIITVMNALYQLDSWLQALLVFFSSTVTRMIAYALVIVGFFVGHHYQLYDGNALVTDWILKPMDLM